MVAAFNHVELCGGEQRGQHRREQLQIAERVVAAYAEETRDIDVPQGFEIDTVGATGGV